MASRPPRQDPTTCPHRVWLRYLRPVRKPAEGIAYNVRCAACGEKAWRG